MKLFSYLNSAEQEALGILVNGKHHDVGVAAAEFSLKAPLTMGAFLEGGDREKEALLNLEARLKSKPSVGVLPDTTKRLSPVPHPTTCRDAYAFRQHVAAARRNRGMEMVPEFDQFPIFYYTNHRATFGEGELTFEADHFLQLDFELEAAIVIGKGGKNISAKNADAHIAGVMIFNDFSARTLQMEEMKLSLGPAKGKDFANAFGPYLVTMDDESLVKHRVATAQGNQYDLKMVARHNGKQISSANLKDMTYTFAEIIERISYGTQIFPGDVIGSGTVGTGCYMELNGTWAMQAKEKGEHFSPVWLKPGDTIELEIEELGILKNTVGQAAGGYSIMAKKRKGLNA